MKIIIEHDDGAKTEYEVFSVTKIEGGRKLGRVLMPITADEIKGRHYTSRTKGAIDE